MKGRRLLQLGAACLISACLVSAGPAASFASSPTSAPRLLATVLVAVRGQPGARVTGTMSFDTTPAISVASTVLAGTASGTAKSSYTETNGAKSRTFHGQLVLAGGTVFFKGDAAAWYFEMSIMGGPAVTEANRWVAISSKCTGSTRQECRLFQRLASGLTVRTAMAPVVMTGPFSLLPIVGARELLRRRSGSLTVRSASPFILRIIDICGLSDLLGPGEVGHLATTALPPWVAVPAAGQPGQPGPGEVAPSRCLSPVGQAGALRAQAASTEGLAQSA